MRPSFYPRMVNGPFDDPGLFIPFLFEKRAVIFDLGDIYELSARDILKISHVFISHTHMDHFAGFDRLLRLLLGREKKLCIYGPEGFLKNIEGKLAGYSWNLVKHYTNRFILEATEVHSDHLIIRQYPCQNRFIPTRNSEKLPFTKDILLKEPGLSVSAKILDHSIPCLGFSIREQFHVNIVKDRLADLGLEIGPWLKEFKQAMFNQQSMNSVFEIRHEKAPLKRFILGELAEQIAIITPGQKLTYITDVVYSESNAEKIVALAKDADHLFIEASFLDKDRDAARQKYHLTARQAGTLAARARVKQFTLFHFSPRYTGMEHLLQEEARTYASRG
ncbi:MBL fold metallo-hydrolase [Desulfococcaceae bacterium HSG8]|nr:MBL fold metallo-hydrolase [Desulfococcaceae bacterium HSG8]